MLVFVCASVQTSTRVPMQACHLHVLSSHLHTRVFECAHVLCVLTLEFVCANVFNDYRACLRAHV